MRSVWGASSWQRTIHWLEQCVSALVEVWLADWDSVSRAFIWVDRCIFFKVALVFMIKWFNNIHKQPEFLSWKAINCAYIKLDFSEWAVQESIAHSEAQQCHKLYYYYIYYLYRSHIAFSYISNQMESPTLDERSRHGWTLVVRIWSVPISI